MDIFFPTITMAVPPLLAFLVPNRARAVLLGTLCVWLILVTATQYWLAYDPDYNSIAPFSVLVGGWIPGIVYSSICLLGAVAVHWLLREVAAPMMRLK